MKFGAEVAEFVGTFSLVLVGCGAIMSDAIWNHLGGVGIAAAFGLVVTAMIYATGHISGAHFNPAVTLAFASTKHFPWKRVSGYLVAQLLGALAAIILLKFWFGDVAHLGATLPGGGIGTVAAFTIEIVISATLMYVISSVATDGRAMGTMAGVAVGGTVGLAALWAGPATGASMNPARSIAPLVMSGNFSELWIYIVAPVVGMLLGAAVYELVRKGPKPMGAEA